MVQSFEKEFMESNPRYAFMVEYMREAVEKDEVEWGDLTTLAMRRISERICEAVSGNTACTYLAVFKAFLAHYVDEGFIPCKNPNKELKAKKLPSQHIALTEADVMKLDAYKPWSQTEQDTIILFMRGCLTGARCSDAERMTMDNIVDGSLVYVSQKTKTEVSQPVHRLLPKYLKMQPAKKHLQASLNRTIQRICKNIGMTDEVKLFVGGRMQQGPRWKFVSMHTSRRTFCSCLAVRDVPVSVISKLAGHTTTNMTDRYICVNTRKPGDEAMSFYNGE